MRMGEGGAASARVQPTAPLRRVLVAPREVRAMRRFYSVAYPGTTPPPDYVPVYRNASWRVLAAPECR